MIRILSERVYEDGLMLVEAAGLSRDSKPTSGIVTGSTFIEADTGDVYIFAEGDTPAWTKISAGPSVDSGT